jgi:drug/metabolite transporter (DMT)-like permease
MGRLYSGLIGLSLIWGTSFLFIKVLILSMAPEAAVFGRCLFGAITLFLIYLFTKQKNPIKKLPWLQIFFVGLTNNVLPWLFISSSETRLSSSLASIINATTPIWTLIIGYLFFSSHLRKNQWFGIIVGFIGIFILSDFKIGAFHSGNTLGIILMSGATICYGIGVQLSEKHLSKLSVIETSFFTLAVSTIISFFIMLVTAPHSLNNLINIHTIMPLLGLGALGSGVAYILYYYLVKAGSAEFASLVTYLVPVSAIIWGALILNEAIHLSMIIGLLIIFSGVYISSLKFKQKSPVNFSS